MVKISYKDFVTLMDNTINMSSAILHNYALKVAYVANAIFEQKGYSKDKRIQLILLSLVKDITQPQLIMSNEDLNDATNKEAIKQSIITAGIISSLPEFENKPEWEDLIKYQNVSCEEYEKLGSPEDFPKDVFTIRLAENIVFATENLKNLDKVLSDLRFATQEDIAAFNIVNVKKNILRNMETSAFREILFSSMDGYISENDRRGIIKALCIAYDFKYEATLSHSAVMYELCDFIAEKMNFQSSERDIMRVCSYIACAGKFISAFSSFRAEEPTKEEYIYDIKKQIIGITEIFRYTSILNYKTTLYQQFECIDGSGYPLGLDGDDLNLYSKVLSLANRFCELYETTPYRKGKTAEDVCKVLKAEAKAGKYEKRFVDAMLLNQNELLARIYKESLKREVLYYELLEKSEEDIKTEYAKIFGGAKLLNILKTTKSKAKPNEIQDAIEIHELSQKVEELKHKHRH